MEIEWKDALYLRGPELWIDGVDMGWVDRDMCTAHCMWMAQPGDFRVERDHLLVTDYPEGHEFETVAQAKEALAEAAVVMYLGGFRGR